MALTQSVVDAVCENAAGRRVYSLKLEVGALCAVVPDAMTFCFELAVEGTVADGARLDIDVRPGAPSAEVVMPTSSCQTPFSYALPAVPMSRCWQAETSRSFRWTRAERCATCGCGEEGAVITLAGDTRLHGHSHDHDHPRDLDHSHDHSHVHEKPRTETITLEQQKVLAKNDVLAEQNRQWLADRRILAFNVTISPGAGKTTLPR